MKKYLILSLLLMLAVNALAQTDKIDFRTVDIKYLTPQQKREFQRWRDEQFRLMKSNGIQSEIKSIVIQGNKIKTIIYNTGAISNPGVTANVLDLVWNKLGYGYEFGPLVGVRVPNENSPGDSVNIVIDGFGGANKSTADGDFAPDGTTKWGWLPKAGYSAPGQNDLASWGARGSDLRFKPKSWPESWYNNALGEYIFPSFLGGNQTVPDEEVYYVVDDATDKEFAYFPFPSDTTRGGLGLNLEVRTFQFANPLAEDIIFLVYSAEATSPRPLNKVYFGMFGDPHVGGANNYGDDAASFVPAKTIGIANFDKLIVVNNDTISQRARNMVYTWDPDNVSDVAGIPPGYFGYKFLESPNNSTDGIDNDDDGITDEDPFNDKGVFIDGIVVPLMTGISDSVKYSRLNGAPKPRWSGDEDGDWDLTRDDVGVDGIAGTADFGEGNGVPDQLIDANGNWAGSEPNFGFRDVSESDQIGLKSFWSLVFGGTNRPKNDNLMYSLISADMDTSALALLYTTDPVNKGDYIFLYGAGPFLMHQGHRERFSIALLMGTDLRDLILNSETAQLVLEANYRFAQPPPKPKVTAVPGNGRVTLYWDTQAENSRDPLTNQNDFEGYKIYRSEDYTFKDVFTVTDGFGNPFLGTALYDDKAQKSAQWHRVWTQAEKDLYVGGYHPSEYRGRFIKYYMGEPNDASGLRHEYVDSTVTNGKTYYYAVVSFDHGEVVRGLPPSESQATIIRDAVTQEFKYDVNTVGVVPNAMAKGIVSPKVDLEKGMTLTHGTGAGTGKISLKALNERLLENSSYNVKFDTVVVNSAKTLSYSIKKNVPVVEQFIGNDTLFVNLQNKNIILSSVKVFDGSDTLAAQISSSDVVVDTDRGRIRAKTTDILVKPKTYTILYLYYPVFQSITFSAGDANSVFDGVRAYAVNDPLSLDSANSYFLPNRPIGLSAQIASPTVGTPKFAPLDIRIEFTISTADTDAVGNYISPPDSFGTTNPAVKTVKAPFRVMNATDTTQLQALIKDGGSAPAKLGRWDIGEEIIILTPVPYRLTTSNTMMGITLRKQNSNSNPIIPSSTSFTGVMKKPFTSNDAFIFTTTKIEYDPRLADSELDKIIVVPNPYVVTSLFEQPSFRPDRRGDKVVQFRNLPRECTIRIYTMVGELVQTLHKNDDTNFKNWDLLSSESARIGYGVYIYHVETPTGGTKIGRLGIIK